jgi:hypothetical protein
VTIVEKLALKPAELEQWCRELKQALGCGGCRGRYGVLQGDLRDRIVAVLEKKGVTKVTMGSTERTVVGTERGRLFAVSTPMANALAGRGDETPERPADRVASPGVSTRCVAVSQG